MTGTHYAPLRQINITSLSLEHPNISITSIGKDVFDTKHIIKDGIKLDKRPHSSLINSILSLQASRDFKSEDAQDDKNGSDKDRYLSEKEIRSLTEILHTVKKSDLDAIVEIYNLAQDIYKEIDKTSTDQILEETKNDIKNLDRERNMLENSKKPTKHVSYWYEPLASNKIRPAELLRSEPPRVETVRHDIYPAIPAVPVAVEVVSANVEEASQTIQNYVQTTPTTEPISQKHTKIESFFENGPLSPKDFGKLPYYYPMSHFQRASSYRHNRKQPKPVSKKTHHLPQPTHKTITYKPVLTGSKYQKEIKPSILLPYPFLNIIHYNWTLPQNPSKNLYHRSHNYDKDETKQANTKPSQIKQLVQKNAILMNPDLENFQDLQMKPLTLEKKSVDCAKKNEVTMPDWQSDPLPQQILEEVRAHVQEKQKLFLHPLPLRKKVKLERVGQVTKLDEITRNKRRAAHDEPFEQNLEAELYEVYIERTTCNSDYSVPGFFRYGNLSQPYPECCPQRIST
ncbi:hypothetical protein HF086_011109 [Spodoptera exigua]|uniref:Uncharacterized protein n=1 Tax=Spodoptera exigua TaxID=7107 RepID=A0A922SG12_SPOEX|nr:hypothetical protein HF086_011109 [Spodoptera exigua]